VTASRATARAVYAVRGQGIERADAATPIDLGLLPRSLRRGLSGGMKFAIAAAGRAIADARAAGLPAIELPIVYGSAVGETATAVELLTSIVASRESSPVLFRHSVHNAAPGLLSIALQSLASSTAVAAGAETLLAVLLEAAGLLNEGAPAVLVVVAEEGSPRLLAPGRMGSAGAVAWVLASTAGSAGDDVAGASGARAHLTMPDLGDPAAAVVAAGSSDPLAPAWHLADAVAAAAAVAGETPALAIALSPDRPWRVRVAADREALT
jgi:hypothetical protein